MNDVARRPGAARLDRLRVFVAVAEAGGFTAAAGRLGSTKAQVSQQIARLEEELGGALFQRTTRRVALTEEGVRLLERCAEPLDRLRAAVEAFGDAGGPSGLLRVTAPPSLADAVVAPLVARFVAVYPRVEVELLIATRVLDLTAERIDVAFRVGQLPASTLRAVLLRRFEHWAVASPEYLARSGGLRELGELDRHRLVALRGVPPPLDAAARRRLATPVRSDSPEAVLALARAGAGIAVLPDFTVAPDVRAGRLVRLLPRVPLRRGGIHLVQPPSRSVAAKVRAFVALVRAQPIAV